MPKLSEKTLEKRFQCSLCGETFRTRQGFSGHTQFKHQAYYKPTAKAPKITKEIDMGFISSKQEYILIWRASNGLSKSTNDTIVRLLVSWAIVRSFFSALDIELTDHDFKTYLLAGLGKLFS